MTDRPVLTNTMTPDVWEGIRARHSAVESAGQPTEAARAMAYLSHLDRRDLIAEIEQLQKDLRRANSALVRNGVGGDLETIQTQQVEIERLQRLLDMRPPYYCQNCHCARCGNTLPADEPGAALTPKLLLSDMADNLIREMRRQHFVTMQSVFDGMVFQVKPDQHHLPDGMITNAEKSTAYHIPTISDYCEAHGRYPCDACNAVKSDAAQEQLYRLTPLCKCLYKPNGDFIGFGECPIHSEDYPLG